MAFFAKLFAPVLALAATAAPLAAQDSAMTLKGDVMLEQTVADESGNTTVRLVEPNTIVPGDRLVFGTEYANTSAETVENFVVTNPLPAAVRLAEDAPADLIVSVDGGSDWGQLSQLSVAGEDGTSRPASHADVTHVRWTLARVAAGESGRLEYPAVIR